MSARSVRLIVIVVCAGGIAGMIVTTVLKHNGAALTFGIITVVAILCLMVATAVTVGGQRPVSAEGQAARVEAAVTELVAIGIDERAVRQLVREAVRLGRQLGPEPP